MHAARLLGRTLRDSAMRPVGARVARAQIYAGLGNILLEQEKIKRKAIRGHLHIA